MRLSLAILLASGIIGLGATFALAEEPKFTAHTAGTQQEAGAIKRVDKDWSITLASPSAEVAVPGSDLISLRRVGATLPPFPAGPHVVFVNGDRLAGAVAKIEKGEVHFKAAIGGEGAGGAQELTIPLSALAVIWFRSPPEDTGEDLARKWSGERRRRDVLLLSNGDSRAGTVVSMDSLTSALVLKDEANEIRVEAARLVAIALNTDLARSLRPRGAYGRAILSNGGRIGMASASSDGTLVTGKTLFGAEMKIPLSQIVCLDIRQGKAVYLSDLKPKRYDYTPYLGVRWPFALDRSVAGHELRLGGHTYDKGIGLHSESRLTFDLGGSYRRFESTVGLDDRTGQGGSVRIRVLVDGQAKDVGDKEISSATGSRDARVDVTGAKELTLVVEFGSGGDVCDHVDWADARVVK